MSSHSTADADPFDLLGVSEWSSDEAVNAAWRRRMRLCHPDHATDDADRDRRLATSIALNRAHDMLLDPAQRAEAVLRRRRSGAPVQPNASSESPRPRSRVSDTWAGSRWSTRYRAGGHPEARDTWAYSEPAAPPQAEAQPGTSRSSPHGSRLGIVGVTLMIFGETALGLLGGLARILGRVLDAMLCPWGAFWWFGDDD